LLAQRDLLQLSSRFTKVEKDEVIDSEKLNMEKILLKFQEFMYQEYREEDEHFYETN
jgi:hypothetical protein